MPDIGITTKFFGNSNSHIWNSPHMDHVVLPTFIDITCDTSSNWMLKHEHVPKL